MQLHSRHHVRWIALLAVCSALAMILGYIEILIPFSFGIPGMKLGLANFMTVLLLYIGRPLKDGGWYVSGLIHAGIVCCIRIVLISLLFTNVYAMIYSMSGGFLSLLCMWLVSRSSRIGPLGCSIVGGITHNLGQLLVAALIVSQLKIIYYMPVLLLAGTFTGFAIGFLANIILTKRGVREYYDRFFEG